MADVKKIPEVIYLQLDPDDEWLDGIPGEDVDFLDLSEVTWCVDRIGVSDVKYIRARDESA